MPLGCPLLRVAGDRRFLEVTDGGPRGASMRARPFATSAPSPMAEPTPPTAVRCAAEGALHAAVASARRRLETAHLALGLRAPEIIGRSSCLFRRLEHGSEPARDLRQAQEGFCRDIAIVRQDRC